MNDDGNQHELLLEMATNIVSAHVSNNPVSPTDLPNLIETVYRTLAGLEAGEAEREEELRPAVPIKKSITPDYIYCLEDGKKLKMLKRHLKTTYDMTPEEYRAKWKLPHDYPMVAPNYSETRKNLAKKIGLGRKPRG